jgi:antitoxin (DNA-binding transcriptional repressor) of toxin-antitoxin stability system
MEMIKIRDVRGARLAELAARTKEVVGITSNRVLVAVLVPANAYWIQHVLAQNQTRVEQSLAEGEQVARSSTLTSLAAMVSRGDFDHAPGSTDGATGPATADVPAQPHAALPRLPLVGGDFLSAATLDAFVERVRSLLPARLAPAAAPASNAPEGRSRRIRLGDLTGKLIEEACASGDTLVLTNDRMLTGVLLPVTPGLVEQLIEQNLSRVYYNIDRGEQQAREADLLSVDAAVEMPIDAITTQTAPSR